MALGRDDLVLCAATLARVPLPGRIEVAATAGFRGVSLFMDDLVGVDEAALVARLEELGLEVAELDPVLTWVPGVEPGGSGFERWSVDDFLRAAQRVGARSLNAVCFAPNVPEAVLIEAFATLCDRAAEVGVLVHLEFMPISGVRDLAAALRIVDGAARPNAGVMLDVWHFVRSHSSREQLTANAAKVIALQLDDCPAEPEPNLIVETLNRRRMPGEGDADVAGLLRLLDAGGCTAPLGVEVFAEELLALEPPRAAERVAEATRKVVAAARTRAG